MGGGLVALIAAGLSIYFLGHSDGKHAQREAILNAQLSAAERIRDATANAPTNSDALLDELRNGSRKL